MRSNYAQGSYSEQYDDNCICGFLHLVVMLASKLLLFLPHRLFVRPSPRSLSLLFLCLLSCLSTVNSVE